MRFYWSKRPALITLSAIGIGCTGGNHPQTLLMREPEGIVVTATGDADARPDRAHFTVGVEVRRPTVDEAREAGAHVQEAVMAALHDASVPAEHIQTNQLSVQPEYNYTETEGRQLMGYTLRNTVNVRVDTLNELSSILDAAIAAGGDDVQLQGVTFALSDDAEARSHARAEAVEEARSTAAEIARVAGVQLGAPLSIEETSGASNPPMPMMMQARAESDTATPVAAGMTHVEVQVRVRYAIE